MVAMRSEDVGLGFAPPQQLGQHLALPLERLALLRKRLGHGLALPLKRLALLRKRLGHGLALPLKRLALLRKRLGHGFALPLKRLALLFERLDALPHILRHHVNFSISPCAGFPHPLQSYEDRKQPPATDGKLGNIHPVRAIRGLQRGYCPLRQL